MSQKHNFKIILLLGLAVLSLKLSVAQVPNLKFEHLGSENGLPQNTIHGIVKDKYGFMWFGTWGGLCRYDGYSFKVYKFDPANNRSLNNSRVHNIVKDANNVIWVLTFKDNELCRYNYESDDFDRIPVDRISPSFLNRLTRWRHYESVSYSYKHYKWLLDKHTNSLLQLDVKSGKKKYYDSNPADIWSLSGSYAVDIYKDNHDVFWVGTYSDGINKANLNAKPFDYYYHDRQNPNSIIDNNVRAICEDNRGNLWIGTYDKGITVIGKEGYRHIVFKDKDKNNFTHNQIKTIFCDSKGIIWLGTKKGLINYNPATKAFREFDTLNQSYASVFAITEDHNNNIWMACYWQGVYKYVRSTDKIIHLDSEKTIAHKHARSVIEDRNKQIWVGTEGGGLSVLKQIKDTVEVLKRFFRAGNEYNTISDNRINFLFEDKLGLIWIGTGNGLNCYNPTLNKFITIPEKTGLTNVIISGITDDDHGFLWISHKNGITKLNKKTLESRTYTMQDGLQSNEFSDGAVFKGRFSKKLYFGSNNGFNAFNPDSIRVEKTLPNTVLTELEILNNKVGVNEEVNGRVVLHKPLYLTTEIELTYDDKSIAIQFAGLHYANPKANKYAYQLEGFDEDWVYTDANRRIANYSNLKPGQYIFKVISSNPDGVWNLKPATLKLVVKPPLWASNWAYMFYGLIILMIIYLYHYYSTKFTRLQSKLAYESLVREKEQELYQSKLQFFTNISHEIKTPLTLILAPLEKLSDMFTENKVFQDQILILKHSGDRLLKLVNQLLDFRKLETGNVPLQSQSNDAVSFLHDIMETFRPLAETKSIQLEFSSPVGAFFFSFDEDKLEKVISNLLSNALKFTPNSGCVKISLKRDPLADLAIIEVINTGRKIPDSELGRIFMPFQQGSGNIAGGSGLGLAYCKSLVELHGGAIEVSCTEEVDGFSEISFRIELPAERGPGHAVESEGIQKDISVSLPVSAHTSSRSQPPDNKEENILLNGRVPVILVVDDNTDLRRYLKDHFDDFYQVLEAENGAAGLSVALQELPDLIISDVMMSEMDGFEFCRAIKMNLKTAHIPLILLTARTPDEDKIQGIETGADDYITKPFSLSFLTAKVKSLLVSRAKLKEKYRKEILLQPSDALPVSPDEDLLRKLLKCVEDRISDPHLSVEDICKEVGISRTKLYAKIRALTGLSMAEVIKEIRLKRAKQLLKEKKFNINEIAYMVGFSDTDYFRKCFKAEFDITPSEYYKNIRSFEST
ncbi:two-component regulator propeller domain-containing protein [Paradesertivirga mongoliensis]|uniref:histidine kinase n=1 Tax=Paradesertivirga mongoliensis TaxID=2100740 RepID=A0ABW4ZJZ0_9SPHI|nr:hybrid sensor histidine kinase/response regulator transcription factor [Pedobacter mongoliensis]